MSAQCGYLGHIVNTRDHSRVADLLCQYRCKINYCSLFLTFCHPLTDGPHWGMVWVVWDEHTHRATWFAVPGHHPGFLIGLASSVAHKWPANCIPYTPIPDIETRGFNIRTSEREIAINWPFHDDLHRCCHRSCTSCKILHHPNVAPKPPATHGPCQSHPAM